MLYFTYLVLRIMRQSFKLGDRSGNMQHCLRKKIFPYHHVLHDNPNTKFFANLL